MVVVRLLFSVLMLRYGECNTNLFPPTDASWFDIGAVLLPTEPWEETCVCEPQVYWDADQDEFRMYYRGGWGNMSVGIATSKTGINWTKYKNNPVYGGGGSNVTGLFEGGQPYVFRERKDKYWLFTTHRWDKMNIATSKNGYTWTPQDVEIPHPPGCSAWGNRVVWIEKTYKTNETRESNTYFMLQEAGFKGGVWSIYLYISKNGLKWEIQNNGDPLSSLGMGLGGSMYGGPSFANVNGTLTPRNSSGIYNLWYHAAPAGKGNLPTDIYHAASKDLINWKISLCETPVLKHSGKGWEYDQTADPSPIITPDGGALLYYDADNNVVGKASIGMAISKPYLDTINTDFSYSEVDVTIELF